MYWIFQGFKSSSSGFGITNPEQREASLCHAESNETSVSIQKAKLYLRDQRNLREKKGGRTEI
ncbi:hypothetical protein A33Q_2742 [Indibacter alkaliphilus LW1]|uniref:Uncharacterized protein n=1 Tax=Indibacter alkaliphilus (strain CCUG 57479 / KCTC 22604 / LW1) TaxID=1189612 RepID=S2DB66_INDAL|nr:hypothetical protein A33Q_2742 [Indibacter alkaliphilus LW1]